MSNVSSETDALARVYDDATRARFVDYLAVAHANASDERDVKHVRWLVEVLAAGGPPPSDDAYLADVVARRRACKAALDAYVTAADASGLLDANMVERLRSSEERNFRSARAECVACWLLAGKLGYPVAPVVGGGRAGKQVEFTATTPHGPLTIEVKAPRVDIPPGGIWSGNDADTLATVMREAAGQFGKGRCNVLVIVPQLRTPVYARREQLERLIGDRVMFVPVRTDPNGDVPEPHPGFVPRGLLVRPGKDGPNGTRLPAHTRVSAVVSIETGLSERGGRWFEDHRVTVVHNPNADVPVPDATFARFPQLVRVSDEEMVWTDRTEGGSDDDDN